jgi:hypothetical protein
MKTKLIPVLLLVVFIASSCKKTETKMVTNTVVTTDTVTAIETPFKTTIAKGILVDSVEIDNGQFEEGNIFFSSKNGVITKLGAIFPQHGTYKVTIWDAVQDTVMASAEVVCSDSTQFAYTSITPLHIIANQQYMLCNNSSDGPSPYSYYTYENNFFNLLLYPYSVGSITIGSNYYYPSATSVFPTITDNYEFLNSDFVFQADK